VFTAPEPGLGDDLHPRFSPDGKRVAFFRGSESHRQLWIAEVADATSARPAARAEGLSYGAAWLGADGPLLVAADWFGFRALNLVELPGGQARLLGARGARFPDVSAQGDVIYENATYSANLWMLDLKAGAQDRRLLWPSTRYTNQAEFSPDGRQIAFVSNREGLGSVFVAAPDGEPKLLAPSTEYTYIRPHWSADGRAIHAVRIAAGPARPSVQQAVRIELENGRVSVLEGDSAVLRVNGTRVGVAGAKGFGGGFAGVAATVAAFVACKRNE
jgi:dipeptidyl aminopeptidase/acylaminoacyl peptidase